jgi:filamentous hemagglutinin family protein
MKILLINTCKIYLFSVLNLILSLPYSTNALADVIPDTTLPVNSTISTQGNIKVIEGGTQRENNLFHSFKDFSFSKLTPDVTGDTAYFNNDVGIKNIITRVTGGLPSNIDGIIKSNGLANLFFLNPAGIIFGQNASLDIGGSFIGTTANHIKFADASIFSAIEPEKNPLLTVSTPVGLQFGTSPGEIINESQASFNNAVNSLGVPAGLQVSNGKTLALVGGNVSLAGGNLTANEGRIELGSVAANSFVSLNEIDKGYFLGYSGIQNFNDIQLSQSANIDASGNGGGSVQIFGKNISLLNGSLIFSFTLGSQSGESILINASNSLELSDGSNIVTLAESEGKAGDILVKVLGSIKLLGTAPDASSTGIGSQVCVLSFDCGSVTGNGGNLNLETKQLIIKDGAFIDASTFGAGKAGNILIQTSDSVEIVGISTDGNVNSAILAQVGISDIEKSGNAGNLTIDTQRLIVRDGGQIGTASRKAGNGGNLTINAKDSILLTGTSPDATASTFDKNRSGLFVSAEPDASGNVGSLNLTTDTLTVEKGARISADNFGSGLPASSTLNVEQLIIRDGGEIKSGSFASGNGGILTINAKNSVNILGTGNIGGEMLPSTLFSQAQATGNAGNLIVNTPNLNVSNGGEVTVSAIETGAAGNLTVNANRIRLNQGKLTAETNGGEGANIKLNDIKLLRLENQSFISAQAFNQANGGNISINAPDGFIVAVANQNNDIIAGAVQGQGGKIDITARSIFNFREGRSIPINTSNDIDASSEFGLNGEVTIDTPDVDPGRGLLQLPSGLTDASQQIVSTCKPGSRFLDNSFTVTGRGNLPPNPLQPLPGKSSIRQLATLPTSSTPPIPQSLLPTPSPIVEAQGFAKTANGEILLVAKVNEVTPKAATTVPTCRHSSQQ